MNSFLTARPCLADSSTTLVAEETPSSRFHLNLLSRAAGRPRHAGLARELAYKAQRTGKTLHSEQVSEAVDGEQLSRVTSRFATRY